MDGCNALDLFLLPHQDDEFFATGLIRASRAAGRAPWFVYLTDGAGGAASSTVRCAETRAALAALGVGAGAIWFLGCEHSVPDQGLAARLPEVFDRVRMRSVEREAELASINVTAWEGGHPDHDAAALMAVALGRALDALDRVRQFPLYNAYRCGAFPYAAFRPIGEAGPVERLPIMGRDRLADLRLLFTYRSQWRTFLGLSPFVIAHHARVGWQLSQTLTRDVVARRPHAGPLLYERRRWTTAEAFEAQVAAFRRDHGLAREDALAT
jgi:LmbE family N-acetylglucosaminyl deacetylase